MWHLIQDDDPFIGTLDYIFMYLPKHSSAWVLNQLYAGCSPGYKGANPSYRRYKHGCNWIGLQFAMLTQVKASRGALCDLCESQAGKPAAKAFECVFLSGNPHKMWFPFWLPCRNRKKRYRQKRHSPFGSRASSKILFWQVGPAKWRHG